MIVWVFCRYLSKRCGIVGYKKMFRDESNRSKSCLGPRCWPSDGAGKQDDTNIHAYSNPGWGGCRHYLPGGVYVEKLIKWVDAFAAGQLLIIQSEYFWKEPHKVVEQVTEFLGIAFD